MRFLKLITLTFLLGSPVISKAQDIKWEENRPLVWEDFQGIPDHNAGSVAVTSWNTTYSYKVEFRDSSCLVTFDIGNYFQTKKSWRKRDYSDEYVLGHEQLHFDINELYTRKLAASFQSTVFTNHYQEEIVAIFKKNRAELYAIEAKYDEETHHSDDKICN